MTASRSAFRACWKGAGDGGAATRARGRLGGIANGPRPAGGAAARVAAVARERIGRGLRFSASATAKLKRAEIFWRSMQIDGP